jgi:hypothetical protein
MICCGSTRLARVCIAILYVVNMVHSKRHAISIRQCDAQMKHCSIYNTADIQCIIHKFYRNAVGQGGVVSIATRYGLDGPGLESQWVRRFPRPSR